MQRKDIEEKMGDSSKWQPEESVIFRRDIKGQIDVTVEGYEFTLFSHNEDVGEFYLRTSDTELRLFGNVLRAYQKLASILDYKLESMPEAITVEKQVAVIKEVESLESAKKISQLEGTVSAYEKMIIGREVTISR